jgi:hypothetical protein
MTTNWDVLNKRYQIFPYGLCGKHYDSLDDKVKSGYLYIVPYSVPSHQIYRCCGKVDGKSCNEYIKHTDTVKSYYVYGTNPCPPR